MIKDPIDKIKSKGYWRINFQPLVAVEKIPKLEDCKTIIENNGVHLRGWDYPHFPKRNSDTSSISPATNYYEGWIDWDGQIEYWRMYQSGQFIQYLALKEDWADEDSFINERMKIILQKSSLSVIGTIYQLTEIFEFLLRLVNNGLYEEGVRVNISLNNTKNRKLWIDSFNRVPFYEEKKTGADKIEFPLKTYQRTKLLLGLKIMQ